MKYVDDLARRQFKETGHAYVGIKKDFLTKRGTYYKAFLKEVRELGASLEVAPAALAPMADYETLYIYKLIGYHYHESISSL